MNGTPRPRPGTRARSRRPCWSPAPPATSAAGWSPGCWRPGTASRSWSGRRPKSPACRGWTTSKLSKAASTTARRSARRWTASTSSTTWSIPWRPAPGSSRRKRRWPRPPPRPRPRPAWAGSSTSAACTRPQHGTVHAHAVPGGGGQGLPRQPGGRRRVPGRRGHRLGFGLVRDDPAPDRDPAGHAGPQLGAEQDRGHRRARRAALPAGCRVAGRHDQPDLRHRLTPGAQLCRDDERIRRRGRAPPPLGPRPARPRPQAGRAVGGAGDADSRCRCPCRWSNPCSTTPSRGSTTSIPTSRCRKAA